MNYWQKNFEILEEKAPQVGKTLAHTRVPADYQVLPSKRGAPFLQVKGQRLHSTYDPVKEGKQWAKAQEVGDKEPVVIYGLGLGYHVLPFLEGDREVWVVEPSAPVARLALEHQDLSLLFNRGGLRLGRDFKDLPRGGRLLAHQASRRIHPGLYQRLEAYLAGEDGPGGFLRILVVGPLYGGSHPIARACARGFERLGHRTELLDFTPFYPGYQIFKELTKDKAATGRLTEGWFKLLGEMLLAKVRDFRPDLVFLLAQAPVEPHLLRTLRAEGPLVAFWFVEDFQVFPYWREVAPAVDAFFVLQREPFFSELAGLGLKNFGVLPLAADPEIYRPLDLTPEEIRRYGSAISFLGAGYRNRREFFQGFLDFDFKIWGSDWSLHGPLAPYIQDQGARVSEEDAVKIFNASRINLNLHSSPYHVGINPVGDYLNPRVFDLAAAGAFQLVDRRAQLPEFFEAEEELATFTNLTEAREKIDYFLAYGEERLLVAQRGRERCLRDHTYSVRLEQALEMMENLCPGKLPQRPWPDKPLAELRQRFPEDHPVQAMLARMPAEVENLGQLVNTLKEGEAPLTEPEAIFWLLHEFQQGLERGRF